MGIYRIKNSWRLQKASKIIWPNTSKSQNLVPHPVLSWEPPGMLTPPPPVAAHCNVYPPFQWRNSSWSLVRTSSGTTWGQFLLSCQWLPGWKDWTPPCYLHNLSLTQQVGHVVIEGDQAGQAGPAFPKVMLASFAWSPGCPVYALWLHSYLLRSLSWHWSHADRLAIPWILLTTLLGDGRHTGQPLVIWDLPS